MFSQHIRLTEWFTCFQTLLLTRQNTHKRTQKPQCTHQRAEDKLSKKTGWWSNWFSRDLVMFVQRSCLGDLFHMLGSDSSSAALRVWGWSIFQKSLWFCRTDVWFLQKTVSWHGIKTCPKTIFYFNSKAINFDLKPCLMINKPCFFSFQKDIIVTLFHHSINEVTHRGSLIYNSFLCWFIKETEGVILTDSNSQQVFQQFTYISILPP